MTAKCGHLKVESILTLFHMFNLPHHQTAVFALLVPLSTENRVILHQNLSRW